jgi:hypothetical protein
MVSTTASIWGTGDDSTLDSSIKVGPGIHTLVVTGTEGCCDGTTKWTFRVNGGDWENFTVDNLNKYRFYSVEERVVILVN